MISNKLVIEKLPVSKVTGVTSQKAALLQELGVQTVLDLLWLAPSRFEDFRIQPWTEVRDGEKVTLNANIQGVPVLSRYGGKRSRVMARFFSDPISFQAVWFNQPFMQPLLQGSGEWMLTGKWDARLRQLTVSACERMDAGHTSVRAGTVQPVYPLVAGLTQGWVRKVMQIALEKFATHAVEWIPEEWLARLGLLGISDAFVGLHQPRDHAHGQAARKRFAYEECFMFQSRLFASKQANKKTGEGIAMSIDREAVRHMVLELPFKLTTGQKYVIKDILEDLEAPSIMQRLLQGDVGSGKTVVAAVAAYAAFTADAQSAFMVPTELLAEQQARAMKKFLQPHGVEVALLTGSTTERNRRELLAGLQLGLIHVLIGTHALIQDDVHFRKLGFVVIDEQHRFGVQQRATLREKGLAPDVLTMTATPIPRTLAITIWGDLDVSTLREKPAGRQPIETFWLRHDQLMSAIQRVKESLSEGRQLYVICPLIEESEMLDVQNAVDTQIQFQQALSSYVVGLLHGRLTNAEKEGVMRQFVDGTIHALVSTTVVEVGVDVPNATEMIILDSDRFGLSQLHQLRGRVGRGIHRSRCWLIADPKSENGKQRMQAMTDTEDGFEIARRDLELRGPGDYFGTKQSGIPTFRFVDVLLDAGIMEQARDDVADLWRDGKIWTDPQFSELRGRMNALQIVEQRMKD